MHWKTIRYINLKLSNVNRTEWSPIRSVIIRVINKIGRPRSGSSICLITSIFTDRIGRHEVLLLVIYNALSLNQNTRNFKTFFLPAVVHLGLLYSHVLVVIARTVQLLRHVLGMTRIVLLNYPIKAEIRALDIQSDLEFCYSYDYKINRCVHASVEKASD